MAVLKTVVERYVRSGRRPVPERSSIRAHALGSSREHSGWRQIWPFLMFSFFFIFLVRAGRGWRGGVGV